MLEQAYQKKIVTYLEKRGAYVVKVVASSKKGVPDVLCCYRGHFLAIEIKTPTTRHKTTKLQEYNLRQVREAKGYAFVAVDVDDVAPFIEEIDTYEDR